MRRQPVLILALGLWIPAAAQQAPWSHYGADAGGTRYSPARQVTPANVEQLRVAWTYHTGALEPPTDLNKKAAFEATPILIDGTLYLSTPFDQIIALDPRSGAQRWKYDPEIDRSKGYSEVTSRGVEAWQDPKTKQWRIFLGTIDARLIAVDAMTGKPCEGFGQSGQIDLTADVKLRNRGDYQVTSPPAVYRDLLIVGSSIGDNRAVDLERGIVRAFDARSGKLAWTWDPTPWAEHNSPRTGAANAWGALAVDAVRGLVFIPTGSASPDFFGGLRPGDNKHANSIVALRAATGELAWAFQVVHHDLWDYDIAAQPSLFTYGKNTPAVAVTTKMGHLFVFHRDSGQPIYPIMERPVPKSDVPGEEASVTQPFPSSEPMVPQGLTADQAWGTDDQQREACREKLKPLRADGMFTPPSTRGMISFPGNVGGVNWGSAAVDTQRQILVANTNHLAFLVRLIPRDEFVNQVTEGKKNRVEGEFARQTGAPYAMYREPIFAPNGLPCSPPPWGTVVAMDLATGKKKWETPLGSMIPGNNPGLANLGSINLGGPMITAGGLVFTAAAFESFLRAFDIQTGKEVWKGELPASAQATPMSYIAGGKQYIVICAGGHGKLGTKMGDAVVAFALP
jgi:quinoprotein glucose dehydrogenase